MRSLGTLVKKGTSRPFQAWATEGGACIVEYAENIHKLNEEAKKAKLFGSQKDRTESDRMQKLRSMPIEKLDEDTLVESSDALPRHMSKAWTQAIIQHLQDHPTKQLLFIANEFGVSRDVVKALAAKHGLQRKHDGRMEKQRKLIIGLLEEDWTVPAIAAELGVSLSFVYSTRKRWTNKAKGATDDS